MTDERKPDFVMPDGTAVNFDLNLISHLEFTGLFDAKEPVKKSDATLAKVGGIDLKTLQDLPQTQYRRYVKAFFKRANEPLSDPND